MATLTIPSTSQSGNLPVCPAGMHRWLGSPNGGAWLVCECCGTPACCQACVALAGDPTAFRLPEAFCPRHQADAAVIRIRPLIPEQLTLRLLSLVGSIPSSAWHRLDTSPLTGPALRASLILDGLHLGILSSLIRDQVRVWVEVAPNQPPVLYTEGPERTPVVRVFVPGIWVSTACSWVTLRQAEVR